MAYDGLVGTTNGPLNVDASTDQSGGPATVVRVVLVGLVVSLGWAEPELVLEQPARGASSAAVPTAATAEPPRRRN